MDVALRLSGLLVTVLLALSPRIASACAVCGAADRTLPLRGEEVAFAGRVRATLDARLSSFAARQAPLTVAEQRLVPGLTLAVSDDVLVAADVPLLRRALSREDAVVERFVLGDAEARVSYVASRSSSRRVSFFAGAKAPTSPLERDAFGQPVPTDLQPGCGSVVPMVGATYTVVRGPVSLWSTASLLLPFSVRSGPHPGDSLRAALVGQLQPWRSFAVRASVNGRIDSVGAVGERADPASGGMSAFVVPELVVSPIDDLVVSAGAAVPVLQETRGYRVTAPIAMASVGWDF